MFYYYKSVVQLEIRGSDIFSSSFIIKDCFNYPVFSSVCVSINSLSIYVRNFVIIHFDGRFIESVD